MIETFTTNLKSTNTMEANQKVAENLENHEIMFYDSLRADLDAIQMTPKDGTIENILTYSSNLR